MHGHPIVPHDHVMLKPMMSVDKAFLGGEFGQFVSKCMTLIEWHAFDLDAMGPNIECSAPRRDPTP